MLKFDSTLGLFLFQDKELKLNDCELIEANKILWVQSISLSSNYRTPGKIDANLMIDKHRLSKTEWQGKSVLVIGCFEGFEAFYIEAHGASKVVLIQDDLFHKPSPRDGQFFLKKILKSNVILLDKKVSELSKETIGEFDVVLFCNALIHTSEPYRILNNIADISRDEFIISTPFFISSEQYPICMYFYQHGLDHEPRNIVGPSRSWIYCAFDQFNFHIEQSTIWETDHMVAYLRRRNTPRKVATPKILNELPTDEGMEAKTAILLITCKKYEQAWLPFFTLFKRYWPDCPYRIHLASDFGSYPGINCLNSCETGTAKAWTRTLMAALAVIPEERIILFQEDFLISSKVDNDKIRRLVRHAYDHNAASLRIMPVPPPSSSWHACSDLGHFGPFDDFRFSMQCSIWSREILLSLLSGDEDPWTCEFVTSRRSQLVQMPFLGTWTPAINYYCTAIVQGKWEKQALELLKKEGIPIDNITEAL